MRRTGPQDAPCTSGEAVSPGTRPNASTIRLVFSTSMPFESALRKSTIRIRVSRFCCSAREASSNRLNMTDPTEVCWSPRVDRSAAVAGRTSESWCAASASRPKLNSWGV